MRIALRIDELVLDGFSHDERARVGPAAERELARLVALRGLPGGLRADTALERVRGSAAELGPGAGGDAIGAALAGALYGVLGR